MDTLNEKEAQHSQIVEGCNWVPEYGAWMVEATPDRPYTGFTTDLLRVERNMRLRRVRMLTVLQDDEVAPTISSYFMLGAQGNDGSVPPTSVGGPRTESDYIGDGIINPHPRFGTLTANIRHRRGSKVNIRVPLFRDVHTPEYSNYTSVEGDMGDCCGSDAQQIWRYGKGDICMEKYGKDFVIVGCSKSSTDEEFDDTAAEQGMALQKWLVDVKCPGCKGLFYRRAPHEIVPDADWPRNGDVVVGYEVQNVPGWVRLQNGYYLPMQSEDGEFIFLHKVSARVQPSNSEMKRLGSTTPMFHSSSAPKSSPILEGTIKALLEEDAPENGPAPNGATATMVLPEPTADASPGIHESVRPAIHMDAMAFGMGNCCLQITFQAKDIEESRFMYDQLAVMAPIMMALTASTPILKGRLADTDCRWGVICESVDCRTPAERGREDPNAPYEFYSAQGMRRIYKSRYDSISTYIYQWADSRSSLGNRVLNIYNDIPVPIDEDSYKLLRESGVDPALAQHVAHLFIRDPLVVFDGAVEEINDSTNTEHWESIQSTNWYVPSSIFEMVAFT
jgi:Glutamate-cysteine ligase